MHQVLLMVYSFDELTPAAQRLARESLKQSSFYPWYDWSSDTLTTFKEFLKLIGFKSPQIDFSALNAEHRGASFTGKFVYSKKALEKFLKSNSIYHQSLDAWVHEFDSIISNASSTAHSFGLKRPNSHSFNELSVVMTESSDLDFDTKNALMNHIRKLSKIFCDMLHAIYLTHFTDECVNNHLRKLGSRFLEDGYLLPQESSR